MEDVQFIVNVTDSAGREYSVLCMQKFEGGPYYNVAVHSDKVKATFRMNYDPVLCQFYIIRESGYDPVLLEELGELISDAIDKHHA